MMSVFIAAPVMAQDHTTGNFHGCPPEGDPTATSHADPYLNALKNRDVAPASYTTKTVAAIKADKPFTTSNDPGKARRDTWTQTQRNKVEGKEDHGIRVEGYLAGVEKEKSCNCGDTSPVDYHMWLVSGGGQKKSQSMVVEISARMLDAHPNWPTLAKAAKVNGDWVRISGWWAWDQEHPEQLHATASHSKTRATLWEIHPIHMIEVQDFERQLGADRPVGSHRRLKKCRRVISS